jgi:hypothetical protein
LKETIATQILLGFLLGHCIVSTGKVLLKSVRGTWGGSLVSVGAKNGLGWADPVASNLNVEFNLKTIISSFQIELKSFNWSLRLSTFNFQLSILSYKLKSSSFNFQCRSSPNDHYHRLQPNSAPRRQITTFTHTLTPDS